MSVSATCAQCGTRYRLNDSLAGKKATCRKCGAIIAIPAAAPAFAPADLTSQEAVAALSSAPAAPAAPAAAEQSPAPSPRNEPGTLMYGLRALLVVAGISAVVAGSLYAYIHMPLAHRKPQFVRANPFAPQFQPTPDQYRVKRPTTRATAAEVAEALKARIELPGAPPGEETIEAANLQALVEKIRNTMYQPNPDYPLNLKVQVYPSGPVQAKVIDTQQSLTVDKLHVVVEFIGWGGRSWGSHDEELSPAEIPPSVLKSLRPGQTEAQAANVYNWCTAVERMKYKLPLGPIEGIDDDADDPDP